MIRTLVAVFLLYAGILLGAQQDCLASNCYTSCASTNPCSGYQNFEWGGWYGSGNEYCRCIEGLMWTSCEQADYGDICRTYYWYSGRPSESSTAWRCEVGDFCSS
jgi:hypothetical protein